MKSAWLFRRLSVAAFFYAAVFALCPAVASGIGNLYVVNTTSDSGPDAAPGDGFCETAIGNGVCTLRAAIDEANGHQGTDGIRFNIPTTDPGYDAQTGRYTINLLNALPNVSDNVNITGPGADRLTVRPNSPGFGILTVTATGVVNLSGLTASNGGKYFGVVGGVYNSGTGTVNITNCTLSNNHCHEGGGARNSSAGTLNITNSLLTGNSAERNGGGVFNDTGTVNITNSTLTGNYINPGNAARFGGCISNVGTLTVTRSTISNNFAVSGGGIYSGSGTVSVNSSTVSGNFADFANTFLGGGGGIYIFKGSANDSRLNVTNSTLTGNGAFGFSTAGGGGGAILNSGGILNITNSTISDNHVFGPGNKGGGIFSEIASPVNVKSSIIATNWADSGPDVKGAFASAGFNLIGKKDGSTGFSAATDKKGSNASPLSAGLDPKGLRSNGGPTQTIALAPDSPAIDKGTSASLTGVLTTDQRGTGFPRTIDNGSIANAPGGDGTDVGAFELGAP